MFKKKKILDRTQKRRPLKTNIKLGAHAYNTLVKIQMTLTRMKKMKLHGSGHIDNILYLEGGNKKGPTVLFIHGFADSKEGVLMPSLLLSKKYHILAPDLPGFGESPQHHGREYNLDYYTDHIEYFIKEKGISHFHIVGNSLGGAISLNLILRKVVKAKTLTLIDTAGFFHQDARGLFHQYAEGLNIFQVGNEDQFHNLMEHIFHIRPKVPRLLEGYFYQKIKDNSSWYGKLMDDLIPIRDLSNLDAVLEESFNDKVSDIDIPTLILWGAEDRIFPLALGKMAKERIPNSELQILENCGHVPQIENFREFVRLLKHFIGQNTHD